MNKLILLGVAASALFAVGASAQTLQADYQLQNVYTSSVGTIGPLTVTGDATQVNFITDTVNTQTQQVLQIGTGMSTTQAGVQTQTSPFINPANYSAVLLSNFTINSSNTGVTKVFDFKNLSSDAGLYINDATGVFSFYSDGMVPMVLGLSMTPAVSGQYLQIVLTRDSSTNLVTMYANGVSQFSFTDSTGLAVLGDATVTGNAYLTMFQDDGTGIIGGVTDENTRGNIARLRLYDGVLSPAQVAALDTTAPIPEPTTFALLGLGGMLTAGVARRRRCQS